MDIIGKSYMFISSDILMVKMKTPKSFSSHNGHQNRQSLESGFYTTYSISRHSNYPKICTGYVNQNQK